MRVHRRRYMAHDHDAMLAHLVNEWGCLGVVHALLDPLPATAASQVIGAYSRATDRWPNDVRPQDRS